MRGRTGWIVGTLIAVVVAVVVAGVWLSPGRSSASRLNAAPLVGHLAPAFSLADIQGHTVSLRQYSRHIVLLDFFATWCRPCRQEMPLLGRLYRAHHPAVEILAIDENEPRSDVATFARDLNLPFAPLLDPSLEAWRRYGIDLQPVSYWIDGTGTIRAIHYGPMDPSYVRHELNALQVT
ncbi:MAG: TlpA family protein disulfide reductase [Chloroflexota bacterium]|nr:TlpA family protein disulfide reductase [Chloroflexota bacterium]